MNKVTGILLLAGTGTRFGNVIPKQFMKLGGKEIFQHTIAAFEPYVDELILVCHPDWIEHVKQRTHHTIVPGGNTRQESSYNGTRAASHEIVLIHDAVRPFVSKRIIEESIAAVQNVGASDVCIPSADTIIEGQTTIQNIPDRSTLMRGQTPQGFRKNLLLKAHTTTKKAGATDDCQLVHDLGHPIAIVQGEDRNIKITTTLDLTLAEQLLKMHSLQETAPHSLVGKTYVIIGGTGGIGSAFIQSLEKAGANTIPLSFSNGFDATSEENVRRFFTNQGMLDGVICAHGYLHTGSVESLSYETIRKTIDVNFTSLILIGKFAQIQPGGHLLNIASSSYSSGRAGYAVYSASKAAVVNFTSALALERSDIHINTLIPGRTDTAMRRENFGHEENLLSPEEVAQEGVKLLTQSGITGIFHEVRSLAQEKLPTRASGFASTAP